MCDAEVGKPGAWRGCRNRRTVLTIVTVYGTVLHYCEQHKDRLSDPASRYHAPILHASWSFGGKGGGR